jgi:hypothetical protein
MNEKEKMTWKESFPVCKHEQEREDVIFVFPDEFEKSPEATIDDLQRIIDFLKYITEINPTEVFEQRIVVGYSNKGLGWSRNRINVPWKYLKKPEEPLDACTHELVHPFFRASPLHGSNEGWGEGFCDFLRGPVKNIVGLDGDEWWQRMLKAVEQNMNSEYHYPAGKFVLKAFDEYRSSCRSIETLINAHEVLKAFVGSLFSTFKHTSLSTYIEPSLIMKEKWLDKGKI